MRASAVELYDPDQSRKDQTLRTYHAIYALTAGAPVTADEMRAYGYNLLYCMPLTPSGDGSGYRYLITICGPEETTYSAYAFDAVNDALQLRGEHARAYSCTCVGHYFEEDYS